MMVKILQGYPIINVDPLKFVQQIQAAGIVGAGGGGFPAYAKLNPNLINQVTTSTVVTPFISAVVTPFMGYKIDMVIANGAECEPLLYHDKYLMTHRADQILAGLSAVMLITKARQAVIALKSHAHEAVSSLQRALDLPPHRSLRHLIRLHLLPDFYPAGDEHSLVYEVSRRIIPEGGIPLNVGILVQNVSTLAQIALALQDKPVISRLLTVTGEVNQPKVMEVAIGASIDDIIGMAGGARVKDYRVLLGGPMMGWLTGPDEVVTKTTGGIIVLPADHYLVGKYSRTTDEILGHAASACEVCRICTDLCPRYLLGHRLHPHLAIRAVSYGRDDMINYIMSTYLCCQCGICDMIACPCQLSPRRVYAALRKEFARQQVKYPYEYQPDKPREEREGRKIPLETLIRRLNLEAYVKRPIYDPRVCHPQTVRLKLQQHIGSPALPLVKVGDKVKSGQLIADVPQGKLGSPVHASIAGYISQITPDFIEI